MMLADVEKLLREAIGLHVETVGGSVVQYALKQRMAACRFTEASEYWRLLTSSRQELQELVNAVIIPETWFFRDREAFAAMARHARANLRPGLPIQMLSLPCSSGEEPYSMAMAMFDAGFAASDFTVDGVDVSTRNIAEATRAIYGRNSFRGADLAFRARYFDPVDGGHRPNSAVLKQVRFSAGNLFDPAATSGADSYDIVFCRNLLIYFDRELQQRALDRLRQLLRLGGLLLVGPAESSLPTLFGFASARTPMAFAFVKQESVPQAAPVAGSGVQSPARPVKARRPTATLARVGDVDPAKARGLAPARHLPISKPLNEPASPLQKDDPAQRSLEAVERAANAGRLEEAKQAAHRHIETFGPSPGIFYLLGLAHDAGRAVPEAIENYRKALYLAPDHRETLAHLSLLLERQGDMAGAKVLNSRLGRIAKRNGIG
ncbi:protein-glutamate O-methyltransferase CheR [Starkeya sp. ORNL1]|uniref:CheR family methyltransferase n=1 Tax=Starkeya sp. ORNL1 TaxID=2709380 RepID=UPI0014631460|nr:protein-glutamate O-methyltransferase CheR [Starkeya sp. ORNL1]QJP17302.1 protein-glutamate O-methyltransferase CheR [Starkeya sp. ORNL1]